MRHAISTPRSSITGFRARRGSASTALALAVVLSFGALTAPPHVQAQVAGGSVSGRVLDAVTGEPLSGTLITVEGTELRVLADSAGRFVLLRVPPGPQVLRAERIGHALLRDAVVVPAAGTLVRDLRLAASALRMPGLIVTADPSGRARGELGTASVIEREAIRHQTAASLAGLLELVPGIPLRPPGLDGVQQVSLRSVPISGTGGEAVGPGASDLASAGTLIIMDGVPLSNNANLQSLGPRGELGVASSAGGGVDLRRVPAVLIDRVEVVRGVPSARYGDLTQGAVVVETRAGAVESDVTVRRDRQTVEASAVTGHHVGDAHTATIMVDVARTLLQPGAREDDAWRAAGQLAHRFRTGAGSADDDARFTLDTRIDYFRLFQDSPENEDIQPGRASRSRDSGICITERARLRLGGGTVLHASAAIDHQRQRSFTQAMRLRGAMPFTSRLEPGRATGRFVGGPYIARVDLDGDPWLAYGRIEAALPPIRRGADHDVRLGAELRREWNGGPGYQFDIEHPPQVTFNGVQGFDRPRRYDAVPPMATSALYIDDRITRTLAGTMHLAVQVGARVDALHAGTNWLSRSRDIVLQPRLNAQLAPAPWLRFSAGIGRTTRYPTLGQLNPAPQYHDVVNVNWFANDPAERLAVLTTSILDPTNPDLRMAIATKREAGIEIGLGTGGVASFVAFDDRTSRAIGLERVPTHLLREHYQLTDSTAGTGRPPSIIEPAYRTDTVPVLLLRPSNALALGTRGFEASVTLPELRPLRTRLEVQGAWTWTRLESAGIEVGSYFQDFQLRGDIPRTPYWEGTTRTGERVLLNYRLIHQQPAVGLVITTTVQHTPRERLRNIGGRDSLSFAGYITRTGDLVPVPQSERWRAEYADLQMPRRNVVTETTRTLADWLLSVQVAKTLPLDGRVSFYAFNAFDRVGQFPRPGRTQRLHPPLRFGVDVNIPPGAFIR